MIKRGDIWLVNLDPTIGHEVKKTRPAVIIQNDQGNKYSPTTIIAPITSKGIERIYPVEILLKKSKALNTTSKILFDHLRAVDKQRLIKKLGRIPNELTENMNNAIKISLGLTKIQ